MSWRDRPYSGEGGGSSGFGGGFGQNPLNWSPSIGTFFNIRVQVHILFLLFIGIELLRASDQGFFWWQFRYMTMLFGLVLLHEFGHCFGARSVGGEASNILMWPLGGLASVSPPHNPWAHFWTALAGPLVNVGFCVLTGIVLTIWTGTVAAVPLNPFHHQVPLNVAIAFADSTILFYLYQFFYVNYILAMFNVCVPMYPLDGGRMLQATLWQFMGYQRSMMLATTIGMVGAVLLGCYGLFTQNFMLLGIAIFGYVTCMQERRYGMMEPEFSSAYTTESSPGGWRGLFKRRGEGAWARKQKQLAEEQAEVDRILRKVHDEGLASLSRREKKTLARATQLQREREQHLHRSNRL